MKTLLIQMLVGLNAVSALAEKVDVYQCETKFVDVEWGKAGDLDNTSKFQVWRTTKKAGTIETESLFNLANAAWNHEHSKEALDSDDPFFGDGDQYILKDSKGRFYLVFFEYEKVAKRYDCIRIAINEVPPLGVMNLVFAGSPYEGTSFDKALIAQLKVITRRLAETNPSDGEKPKK